MKPLSRQIFLSPLIGLAIVAAAVQLPAADQAGPPPTPEQAEFFEKQIRPLLLQHCVKCHGDKSQEAGLRLDSRAAIIRGSDKAQIVVIGEPEKSRLIAAVRYNGDVQMPPEYKLTEKDYLALVTWIRMGLPWPGDANTAAPSKAAAGETLAQRVVQSRANHWAFQPVRKAPQPTVGDAAWCRTPVDRFILAELEKRSLKPSPPADRRTLLRRATFDLTGLPATEAEVAAFLADTSPDAFAMVVDRLLASPEYGERWGRHWLDIARYSDTKGYVFTEEKRYPFAYTYRDYVVRAFNDDLPYNQFVLEQIAADRLPHGNDLRSLAALGFLTVGRRFSNNQHDIIDDRIDVVTRGLLGLTVACARCHDHKYDAIPTADYYSLYGVFQSCTEPKELPLIGQPEDGPAYQKYQQDIGALEGELDRFVTKERDELQDEIRTRVGDYLAQVVLEKLPKEDRKDEYFSISRGEVRPKLVTRWREYLAKTSQPAHPVFALWHRYQALKEESFAAESDKLIASLMGEAAASPPVNLLVKQAFVEKPPKSLLDVVRIYDHLLVDAHQQWRTLNESVAKATAESGSAKATPPDKLPDAAAEELRQALYGPDSPATLKANEVEVLFDRVTRNKHSEIKKKVEALKANSPAAPPRAMVMNDSPTPSRPRILLRGNPARSGPEVPRQFLEVLSGEARKPFQQGSGRLELAQAIVASDNPLTARVMVNRVWLQHFGSALVPTPSDFGVRCEPPTHPQLLDYLAANFVEEGWSLKKLHRTLMLSSTYQQASDERPEAARVDPENRWLYRTNRRRLEFEAVRDALLAVSGKLDRKQGGRPVDLMQQPFSARRTIYGLVDRQDLPDMFRVFDFASPDASTELRPKTTVPQQGLFMLNAPFVLEQVRTLTLRPEIQSQSDASERVQSLYRLVLARAADPHEVQFALAFVESQSKSKAPGGKPLSPWEMYAQVLLMTNEFMFVD